MDDQLASNIALKIQESIRSAVSMARQLQASDYMVEMSVDGWRTLEPTIRVTRAAEIWTYPK